MDDSTVLVDLTGGKLPAATLKKLTEKFPASSSRYMGAISKLNELFVERSKRE